MPVKIDTSQIPDSIRMTMLDIIYAEVTEYFKQPGVPEKFEKWKKERGVNYMSELLTRKEAAAILGITVVTLDAERIRGKLAYIQHCPNGKVWITRTAIAEYLARATHPAKPDKVVRETYRKKRA